MDSRPFNIQQMFQERRQFRVPFYQRAFVWSREDQWLRLWDDICDKANIRLADGKAIPHYLGAVVLEPQGKPGLMGVERHNIIDGQQRLTTFQYILTALSFVLREWDRQKLLTVVNTCLRNTNPETMEDEAVEPFKIWPTFKDQAQFVQCMKSESVAELRERFPDSFTKGGDVRKIGVIHPPALEAITFFQSEMLAWFDGLPADQAPRAADCLATAILTDFAVICISLGDGDDAQIIFETLNGTGASLHATDLIRNYLFMRAGTNAPQLYATLWAQFESPIWSEKQSRGRLNKPRMEWFVQTLIEAESGEQIDIGRLYSGYRQFVANTVALNSADAQLNLLNKYAVHYRNLVTGGSETPIGIYGRRIWVWDASATHSLALRIAESQLPDEEKSAIFDSIESYLVRRAICGLSRKGYNKVFAQLLKKMQDGPIGLNAFRAGLAESQADTSRWPDDQEFKAHCLSGDIYPGRLDAPKVRALFHRIETVMRSEKSEERVPLEFDILDIDHILPQAWTTYWPLPDGTFVTAEDAKQARHLTQFSQAYDPIVGMTTTRESVVPTLGNLTLCHYGVNRALQNYAFKEKRAAFFEHSNLQLNRGLFGCPAWDEMTIRERSEMLFEIARTIWLSPG